MKREKLTKQQIEEADYEVQKIMTALLTERDILKKKILKDEIANLLAHKNIHYSNHDIVKHHFLLKYLDDYGEMSKDNKLYFLSIVTKGLLFVSADSFVLLLEFYFKNIEEEDGKIRESTRRAFNNLRLNFSRSFKQDFRNPNKMIEAGEVEPERKDILERLVVLLKKYELSNKRRLYLDRMPASIYKTLCLLYEEFSTRGFMTEEIVWLFKNKGMQYKTPKRIFDFDFYS